MAPTLHLRADDTRPSFHAWMGVVIAFASVVTLLTIDCVYGSPVCKFVKLCFLRLIYYPINSLLHKRFGALYGRYGLWRAAIGRRNNKFYDPSQIPDQARQGGDWTTRNGEAVRLSGLARSPHHLRPTSNTALSGSPTAPTARSAGAGAPYTSDIGRGRPLTRSRSLTSVRQPSPPRHFEPSDRCPSPDPRIQPRRGDELWNEWMNFCKHGVEGAGLLKFLEGSVMMKKAQREVDLAEDAVKVAEKDYEEAKQSGAEGDVLARCKVARQDAVNQKKWAELEIDVVETEAHMVRCKPGDPANPPSYRTRELTDDDLREFPVLRAYRAQKRAGNSSNPPREE